MRYTLRSLIVTFVLASICLAAYVHYSQPRRFHCLILSDQPGTEVFVNDARLGVTPLTVESEELIKMLSYAKQDQIDERELWSSVGPVLHDRSGRPMRMWFRAAPESENKLETFAGPHGRGTKIDGMQMTNGWTDVPSRINDGAIKPRFIPKKNRTPDEDANLTLHFDANADYSSGLRNASFILHVKNSSLSVMRIASGGQLEIDVQYFPFLPTMRFHAGSYNFQRNVDWEVVEPWMERNIEFDLPITGSTGPHMFQATVRLPLLNDDGTVTQRTAVLSMLTIQ